MKYLDEVRVLTDAYESQGVKKGDVGTIILSEIRNFLPEDFASSVKGMGECGQ